MISTKTLRYFFSTK